MKRAEVEKIKVLPMAPKAEMQGTRKDYPTFCQKSIETVYENC